MKTKATCLRRQGSGAVDHLGNGSTRVLEYVIASKSNMYSIRLQIRGLGQGSGQGRPPLGGGPRSWIGSVWLGRG